ncbi:hypothetical protein EV363DRAFT_1583265 [Boletus edulis]|nr:hypothetical protein EV363DRAFT_1583265 [Boletus edulis]
MCPTVSPTKKNQIFYMFYTKGSFVDNIPRIFAQDSIDTTQQLDSSRQRRLPNPGRRTAPNLHLNPRIFAFAPPPPSASEFLSIIEQFGLPRRIYRDPFYSKKVDVPDGPREYAGLVYRLKGCGLDALEEWQASEGHISSALKDTRLSVKKWLKENPSKLSKPARDNSQISGRTQANTYGLPAKRSELNTREGQHITLFSMEVFAPSRGDRFYTPDQQLSWMT